MARIQIEIPRVGLVMEAARVVRWLKAEGDSVVQGEPLLEIETEKSMIEIEAAVSGLLLQLLVAPDDEVAVGSAIAWLEDGAPASAAPVTHDAAEDLAPALPPLPVHAAPARAAADSERLRVSPVARRRAQELGVDLARVSGTGPQGRIQLDDIEQAASAAPAGGKQAPEREPGFQALSSMRRRIARTMTLSNATVPQFTVGRAVDWSAVQALRARSTGVKASANDFLLHAVARALLEFPALNGVFVGDPESPDAHVAPAQGTHIGLVVALPDGMVVPVFHDAQKLTIIELAARRSELVERARAGHLRQEEAGGATFTISNLGAQGPDQFIALINPPESAILAVGRMHDVPLANEGSVAIRPLSQLSLTVDHRVADGKLGAEFLGRVVALLEGAEAPPA